MEKSGYIEIKIRGSKGKLELSPDNFDISEIVTLLQNTENLLFPQRKDRPPITYKLQEGSVRNIFKTSLQVVIGFNALLSQISERQSIDFLEYQTAKAFETFQEMAIKNNYEFEISTSITNSSKLHIDLNTNFVRTESTWVETELYFYGEVINMGGKNKANIHLVTDELGTLIIQTPKEFLEHYEENPLYKYFGIRAKGRQNLETGEIDKQNLVFLEILHYQPSFNEKYLSELIKKAKKSWAGIADPDAWLRELRGGFNA